MFGMDMLVKSFGLDPEDIQKTIVGMSQGVAMINQKLDKILENQESILRKLDISHGAETVTLIEDIENAG